MRCKGSIVGIQEYSIVDINTYPDHPSYQMHSIRPVSRQRSMQACVPSPSDEKPIPEIFVELARPSQVVRHASLETRIDCSPRAARCTHKDRGSRRIHTMVVTGTPGRPRVTEWNQPASHPTQKDRGEVLASTTS